MKLTLVRIWAHLCSGDIGAGSAFLREDGEDGAEPAVAIRERGAGASKEVNCVFMSRTRELVDLCTREGIEVEEEDGGEGDVGERANTGTESAQVSRLCKVQKYSFDFPLDEQTQFALCSCWN